VVLVSWDADAGDARQFLAAQGVEFPTYLKSADESDLKFVDAVEPRWTGVFPTTFLYDAQGRLRHYGEGPGTYAQFETKVLEIANQPKGEQP
jgi:hypothetical protein